MKSLSHKLNTSKALLALFAAFLTCTGETGDFVLCFGEDGHIALETLFNGQCECERRAQDNECHYLLLQDVFEPPQQHDHDHRDIPIFMNDKDKYNIPHDNTSYLFHIPLETSFCDDIFIEVYIIEPLPCINSALASIRSVILLS